MSTTKRGFAALDPDKRREMAVRGGKAAQAKGNAHKFTTEEARSAGRLGGSKISANREHMSRIGRAGGAKHAELMRAKEIQTAAETVEAKLADESQTTESTADVEQPA